MVSKGQENLFLLSLWLHLSMKQNCNIKVRIGLKRKMYTIHTYINTYIQYTKYLKYIKSVSGKEHDVWHIRTTLCWGTYLYEEIVSSNHDS